MRISDWSSDVCSSDLVLGDSAYSLTGVTHTMSTARALEAVRDLLVAPTRPWDALICTSRAVRDLVTGVLERHAAHLAERTGGRMALPLQLPVIPLGIEMPAPDAGNRARFRAEHGLTDDTVAVPYLGRLSAPAKAHPVPMFREIGRAAARSARPLVAVLAGWSHDARSEEHTFELQSLMHNSYAGSCLNKK